MSNYKMFYLDEIKEQIAIDGRFDIDKATRQHMENSNCTFWLGSERRVQHFNLMIAYARAYEQLRQGNTLIVFHNDKPVGYYVNGGRYASPKYHKLSDDVDLQKCLMSNI